MAKINEMLSRYKTKKTAKKHWRSFEQQEYRDKLAKRLKDWRKEWKSKEELAEILWKEQWTVEYAEMMIDCWRTLDVELAKKLIDSWNKKFVLENIENFKNHNEIAKILIDSWNWVWVRNRLNQFNISDEKIKKELEELNKKKEEEEAAKKKELEEKLEKLKEIWEKFLEFGIEYTIDKENLLLNIKWDIKGNTFYDCYKLGIFQYVGKIDGNLSVRGFRGYKRFTFENLKCINWDLDIGDYNYRNTFCEAENLCLVNGNLKIYGPLKAPLKKISWNCDVYSWWSLPSNNLEYIGGNLCLSRPTPVGKINWWIYFPVLRYVGGVALIGYGMGSNKSIEIGDNGIYDGPIYFIDPDDPKLEEKVRVIRHGSIREFNDLSDSIPKSTDKHFHIKHIRSDRMWQDRDDD